MLLGVMWNFLRQWKTTKDIRKNVSVVSGIEDNVDVLDIKEHVPYKFGPPRHLTLKFLEVDCSVFVYKAQIWVGYVDFK
jgi:hypothetical protein